MKILYPAKISEDKEDQGFIVSFYDFKEAITEGDTLEEALLNAAEVLTLTLEGRMDEGMPIPKPSQRKNAYYVAPSARVQSALLVRLATKTKTKPSTKLQNLEDPHRWPSLKQLEKTAIAMKQRLVISLEPIYSSQN